MSEIKVRTNLKMRGSVTLLPVSEFNPTPSLGETSFKDGILYIYSDINGLMTWYPMNRPQSSYVHSQGVPSMEWMIHHDLGTRDVIVGVYDSSGSALFAGVQVVDDNTVKVSLTDYSEGHAVVFGQEVLPPPNIQSHVIDDGIVSPTKTWSSQKISDILGSIDAALDEITGDAD